MNKNIYLDEIINVFLGLETLAIFDPLSIEARIHDEVDWWCGLDLKEMYAGLISLVSTTTHDISKIRITTESLTQNEKDYSRSTTGPLGVRVTSGKVFVGGAEHMSGGGDSILSKTIPKHEGKFIDLPIGDYDLQFYYINSHGYTSQKVANSLPNIVVIFTERQGNFHGIDAEPRLHLEPNFLFPSKKMPIN